MTTMQKVATFSELVGCVLSRVTVATERDEVILELADGRSFRLYHEQNCCESVTIEEIDGTIDENGLVDLVGEVVLATEESKDDTNASESGTWTFYRIGTVKGMVVMRWLGSSNGCYSEGVSFAEVN